MAGYSIGSVRFIFVVVAITITTFAINASAVPAFPGAEGFGAQAVGGRGGVVFIVKNLSDSGPASLRECVEATGPRTCVFSIGGTIVLQSSLEVTNPYLTIAGQTAPGGGITLRNANDNVDSPIYIKTDHVIIRYLRSRPGPGSVLGSNLDAITIANNRAPIRHVIIDHCSFSWATDELVNTWYDTKDVTFQWIVASEALHCSTHDKGCHSKGVLFGSGKGGRVSLHHSLMAHNVERNPLISTGAGGPVDVVNNVIYNPGWPTMAVDQGGMTSTNLVGNSYIYGVNTAPYRWEITLHETGPNGHSAWLSGNIGPHRPTNNLAESALAYQRHANLSTYTQVNLTHPWRARGRHAAPQITTQSAAKAYRLVLGGAGASGALSCDGRMMSRRDTVDKRIFADVVNVSGAWIDHPKEVGGWPVLDSGIPCVDQDSDGMPDPWEDVHGLNKTNATDRNDDPDGDGYTNLEEYLNATNPNQ